MDRPRTPPRPPAAGQQDTSSVVLQDADASSAVRTKVPVAGPRPHRHYLNGGRTNKRGKPPQGPPPPLASPASEKNPGTPPRESSQGTFINSHSAPGWLYSVPLVLSHTHTHKCTHPRTHAHTHTHTHTHTHPCSHTHTCAHNMHTHARMQTYTHTHTHTHSLSLSLSLCNEISRIQPQP